MLRRTITAIIATVAMLPLHGLTAASASAAAPAESKAGVMPITVEGTLPPQGEEAITAKINEGISATGATIIPAPAIERAAGGGLGACTDDPCLISVASKAGVTHLVRPQIAFDGTDYKITLQVLDAATAQVIGEGTDTCELCGLADAADRAGALAQSLDEALSKAVGAGLLTVNSDPLGARVMVDGALVGTTPVEVQLLPGEHTVQLTRDGYLDEERVVAMEAAGNQALDAVLQPAEAVVDDTGDKRGIDLEKLMPIAAWGSIGVGAAALGSGIALMVIDERPVEFTRCTGIDVDAEGNCRFRHNTLVGGIVMTVVGLGGLAVGTWLVLRMKKTKGGKSADEDRRVQLRPTTRGLALHF